MNAKIKLEKKQKIVLMFTIITFMILAWQIYKLVEGDVLSSSKTIVSTHPNEQRLAPITNSINTTPVNNNVANQNKSAPQSNQQTQTQQTQNQQSGHATSTDDVPQAVDQLPNAVVERRPALGSNQKQYLQMVNQYEIVKMQRRLLEEQVAIANARHSIADTEQKTKTIGGGAGGSSFGDMGSDAPYQLRYLGQRNGRWEATILKDGKYQSVKAGAELSDGIKILEIDQRGVLLQVGKQVEKLSFKGITLTVLPDLKPHAQKAEPSDPSSLREPNSAEPKSTVTQQSSIVKPQIADPVMSADPVTSAKPVTPALQVGTTTVAEPDKVTHAVTATKPTVQNSAVMPPLKTSEVDDSTATDNYVLQR